MQLVREFLAGSLTALGGVVEETADGLYVLLPADAAAQLGLAEELRVTFEASSEASNFLDGRLGAPLIERLVNDRLSVPPMAAIMLPAELPRALPEQIPALLNAVRTGGTIAHCRTVVRYAVLTLRGVLQGEEVRSVQESICLRLDDGARVSLPPLERGYRIDVRPFDQRERDMIQDAVERWIADDGRSRLAGALETVVRRARRDLERMAEYYASLDTDMAQAARRARSADEKARRLAKRAALAEDLSSRRAQLCERLKPRLSAAIVAAVLVETDVVRFDVPVRRRRRDGQIGVRLRSADTVFEGPACAVCGKSTLRCFLCDERLHVLCDACGHSGRLDPTRCPACCRKAATPIVLSVDDATARLQLGNRSSDLAS